MEMYAIVLNCRSGASTFSFPIIHTDELTRPTIWAREIVNTLGIILLRAEVQHSSAEGRMIYWGIVLLRAEVQHSSAYGRRLY